MSPAANNPQKLPPDSDVTTDSGFEADASGPAIVQETHAEVPILDDVESIIEVDVGIHAFYFNFYSNLL